MKRCVLALLALAFLFGLPLFGQGNQIITPVPTVSATATLDLYGYAEFSGSGIQYLTLAGEPAIPYQVISVGLPANADPNSVTVSLQSVQLQSYSGLWNVAPMQPQTTDNNGQAYEIWPTGKSIVNDRDVAIYGNNAFFPTNLAGTPNMGSQGTSNIADIPLALFQYNPVTMLLQRLVSAQLVVTFNLIRTAPVPHNLEEPLLGYAIITTNAIKSASTALNYFAIAKTLEGFNVTLVTEDTTIQSFGDIAPVSTAGGWGGGTGNAAANNIHSWLKSHYLGMLLKDVLLIGNPRPANSALGPAGDVPMKMLWPRKGQPCPLPKITDAGGHLVDPDTCVNFDTLQDAPSDFFYAELSASDSDWGDPNMPGAWTDPVSKDRYQEVRVGRIPVYDAAGIATLDTILKKMIHYGYSVLNSPSGYTAPFDNPKWRYYALLPMQDLEDPAPAIPGPSPVAAKLSYTPGWPLGEALLTVLPGSDWTHLRMYAPLPNDPLSDPAVKLVIPAYPNLAAPEFSGDFSYGDVASKWGAGYPGSIGHGYGAVVWYTHGAPTDAQEIFADANTNSLDDNYPAHTFQASCWTAKPEDSTNLAYTLLQKGGINTIGATRPSYGSRYQGLGNQYHPEQGIHGSSFAGSASIGGMAYEYSSRAFGQGTPSGPALFNLKQAVTPSSSYDWDNFVMFNLYGDPSIGVYSYKVQVNGKLKQLSLTYPPIGKIDNGGLYPITATFINNSSDTIQALGFQVAIMSAGAVKVENALTPEGATPGRVGSVVPVEVGPVGPGQLVTVTFNVRLANPKTGFQFWVDAYDFRTWK